MNRLGRGGYHNKRKGWTSNVKELKYDVFEEGTAVKAAQYTDTIKKVTQYVLTSGKKEAALLAEAIENERTPTIAPPPRPQPPEDPNNPGQFLPEDPAEIAIWQEEIRMIAKRRQNLREGLEWLFALLQGQCAPSTLGKIEGEEGYETIKAARDPVRLKERIKRVCCGFQAHQQDVYAMVQAMKAMHTAMQDHKEFNEDWKKKLESMITIVEQFGGSVSNHPGLVNQRALEIAVANGRNANTINEGDVARAREMIDEEIKAAYMISGANNSKFKELKNSLENDYIKGQDNYPRDMEQALGMLNHFRPNYYGNYRAPRDRDDREKDKDGIQCLQGNKEEEGETDGAQMMQKKDTKAEKRVNSKGESNCYNCGEDGHWASDCPQLDKDQRGGLFLMDGATISQVRDGESAVKTGGVKKNYLYADTRSTNDFMVNPAYLTGVHTVKEPLRIHTNAGSCITSKQGYLGLQPFWLD